jgi:hypothetical protein
MALERHRHLVMATPPPSPTHGESGTRKQQSVLLFTDSPLKSGKCIELYLDVEEAMTLYT